MVRSTRFWVGASTLIVFVVLGACRQDPAPPGPLDFNTDPRILRGVWVGENEEGETLRLALKAGPPYEGGYTVEGSFELNRAPPVRLAGGLAVPVTQTSGSLSPQVSPVCGPFAAAAEAGAWELCGDTPEGSPPRFAVWLSDQRTTYTFTVTKLVDPTELPEDQDAPIETDATRYPPRVADDQVGYAIAATYTNTTGASVYLSPCGFEPPVYGLERLEGSSWYRTTIGGLCPAVGGVPDTELRPGETFAATLDLAATLPSPATPQFGIDLLPGVHRLVFVVTNKRIGDGLAGEDDLLPLEQRVSNAFVLKAP